MNCLYDSLLYDILYDTLYDILYDILFLTATVWSIFEDCSRGLPTAVYIVDGIFHLLFKKDK